MAVSYNAATQTARMTSSLSNIDANASPATLEIGTTAMAAVLVTITLGKPSFSVGGAPPNCALTMLGVPKSGTATGTGTAAAARIKDGGGSTIVISGLTVGTSASDIILNSTSITTGQTVTITSGIITHSP
jgi:hypothetical protein